MCACLFAKIIVQTAAYGVYCFELLIFLFVTGVNFHLVVFVCICSFSVRIYEGGSSFISDTRYETFLPFLVLSVFGLCR